MMNRSVKGIIYGLILLSADIFSYFVSLFMAYHLRLFAEVLFPSIGHLQFSFGYFVSLWWIFAIIASGMTIGGMYRKRDPLWVECGRVLKIQSISIMVILTVVSLGQMSDDISRLFICLLWIILPMVSMLFRSIVKRSIFRIKAFQSRAILVAHVERMQDIYTAFSSDKQMGLKVVETVTIDDADAGKTISEIAQKVQDGSFDTAIIVQSSQMQNIVPVFSYLHKHVQHVIYVPDAAHMALARGENSQLLKSQTGYLEIQNESRKLVNIVAKRVFDVVLAIVLLPIVVPVILLLMILVRRSSPGPMIFSHTRVGKNGKPFKVYKLRTMYKDAKERLAKMLAEDESIRAEWEQYYKLKNDPRVTPIGNFLRKSSLDELPQFFNVILGNMSFVGPRPILQEELDKYYKDRSVYYCMAKPGITGLWQVSGRNDTSYDDRVGMDSWYVVNWSLWLDVVILVSTPFVVIFRKGAY